MTTAFPFVIVAVLLKFYPRLKEDDIKVRIGSLYENIRIQTRTALMFNSVFVTRRLIYASVIVLMKETPGL